MRGAVTLLLALSILSLAAPVSADRISAESSRTRVPVVAGQGTVLTSNGTSTGLATRETAGPDTFAIYGGPDEPVEGKFQLADGVTPDWGGGNGLPGGYGGGPDAWLTVDLTDKPVFWHRSQFNAQNLGTGQPSPNHAMWSGVDAGDPIGDGWAFTPGYGNSWNDALIYESTPITDTSVGETVSLDFYFHYDTEPGFDFLSVEYDSAGWWTSVMAVDGSNKDASNQFPAPGVQFSAAQTAPILFRGNDYGGDRSNQIRIRMIVTSDGAWSDEDGLFRTTAGAAQIDDITLTTSQGTFAEDYEAVRTPPATYLFHPDKAPFAGDFADLYPRLTAIDVCRSNNTPLAGFIDYGQIVRNGPGLDGSTSTGGSVSAGINYGIVGNYVVNYNGGLSFGEVGVYNEIWSPEIEWDLPGPADDDPSVSGANIRFTAWVHLPLWNGHFFIWAVRSALAGQAFDQWADRNFVYYGGGIPVWANHRFEVSDLMQAGPERVQMSLGMIDYASVFGFPGTAATPSPCFDNAAFYKYRLAGPTLAIRTIDAAQDGFPVNGSIDVSTPAARGALDIPFSMARDVNSGDLLNTPGDSVLFSLDSVIPGAEIADARLVWALKTNPVFEDALRAAPSRPEDENVVAGPSGTIWTGEAVADSATAGGYYQIGRHFADLPDVDFMYPGDVLHYYIQAIDTDGRTSTLPADTSAFMDFSPTNNFERTFIVRGLPTITDTDGSQPEILVWNDFGRRGGENEWITAFQQLGYAEGEDYDTYTTQGPTSGVSNGLGSDGAHGANADQITGYHHMFYFSGNLSTLLLSNGENRGNNDKGDDIDLLEQWHALPGTRNVVYFGDYIATALINDSAEGLAYIGTPMGIAYGDENVRDVIGGQTAPVIVPNTSGPYAGHFSTSYVSFGGCLAINEFDQLQAAAGASAGHLFTDVNGVPIPEHLDPALGGVASVINPRPNGIDITFPYASVLVYDPRSRAVNLSARTLLFQEILGLFAAGPGGSPAVASPSFKPVELSAHPNPFNPTTVVRFTAHPGSRGEVKVFNLRGELVQVLHSGEFRSEEFRWDGTDQRGATVASGVYVVRAVAEGEVQTAKVALVK